MRPEDQLNHGFVRLHPGEAARQLESYEPEEAAEILAPLPTVDMVGVLGSCQPGIASQIVQHLVPDKVADVINELPSSTAYVVFRQLNPELQSHVVDRLGPRDGVRFRRALHQPKQTAGSLADPRVLTLPPDITVGESLTLMKRNPRQVGYYVYVVDRDAKLKGVVDIKALILADPEDFIATVMNDQVVAIPANLTNEEIIGHPHWQQFHNLPVVDNDGVFLGRLRYRTLQQVIEEMTTRRTPGSLPTALMQLWEAYSLAGLSLMTQLSGMAETAPESDNPVGIDGREHS